MEEPEGDGSERRARAAASSLDPLRASRSPAHRDDLTGLYNRRLLSELFASDWQAVTALHPELSLVMLDLDGFKSVNDRFGHPSGDRVLSDVAGLLRRHFREQDLIVRYGGDEFLVLAPGAGREPAAALARRARDAMSEFPFRGAGDRPIDVPLSFSLGVASYPADGRSPEELLATADRRLYEEKRSRRRRAPRRGLLVALALAVAALVATGALSLRAPELPTPNPGPPAPTLPSVIDAAAAVSARESALLAGQVLELEQTVELLRAELARARAEPSADLEQLRGLDGQVRALQAELARRVVPPAPSPTPVPAAPAPSVQPAPPPAAAPAPETTPPPLERRPHLIRMRDPAFPREARVLRRDLRVRVRVTVAADGRVVRADLLPPAVGFGVDLEALRAAESAVFEPGTRDGQPVAMTVVLEIRFRRD